MSRFLPTLLLACAVAFSPGLFSAEKAAKTKKSSSAVVARLKTDMKYLASDELEGRGVGTKGLGKAAQFIKKQFAEAGLDVTRVNGDAFQYFKLTTGSKIGSPNTLSFTGKDGKKITLQYDRDFRTCSFGRSGKFAAPIVFLGYGIHAPALKYSDYQGVDIKGKAVIILRRNPQQGNPHGLFSGNRGRAYASLRHKYTEAFNRGAVAVLFVNDTYTTRREAARRTQLLQKAKDNVVKAAEALETAEQAKPKNAKAVAAARKKLSQTVVRLRTVRQAVGGNVDELMKFGYGGNVYQGKEPRPIFHISQNACNRLLKAAGTKTLAELEAAIDKTGQPQSRLLPGCKAEGQATLHTVEERVANVIGVLEGEGPMADETIIIGAHYDHVGYGKYGSRAPGNHAVHNGADDNASGTVSLIELARRLAARKKKLPRRIVFIAFTAEELGLIGSRRYVENPVFPLEKTIAMFNMDMVGRLRDGKLTIFCVGSSPRWPSLLQKYAGKRFKLTLNKYVFPRSDHASFARKKIPAIHFFTNTHTDYHRPSDDWQKINFEGMADVIDVIEQLVIETAQTPQRPKFTKTPEQPRSNRVVRSRWPYFGSVPDYGAQVAGLRLSGTAKNSPAEKAGLKEGDIIIQFGRYKVANIQDFAYALSRYKAGDTVEIIVKRDKKQLKLKATLQKPR